MTDRTASSGRAVERSKSARRGGPSGRQAVGDYVGQPAGDAAQAVRRAGLRPGLDRSFGCAEELTGLVVAQEPTAGSSMARNGMVTLYVAAPGSEPIDEGTDAARVESGGLEPVAVASVEAEQAEAASAPARVRRRKRGRSGRAAPAFDAPLAPALPDRPSGSEPPTVVLARPAVEPPWELQPEPGGLDGEPLDDEAPEELGEEAAADEEFVVHVEDVLAGRSGPVRWRGVYPRRGALRELGAGRGVRAWLREHRVAGAAVGAAILLWAIVGFASALDGQNAHTPARSEITRSGRPATRHRTQASKRAPAPSSRTPRAAPRSAARTAQARPVFRARRRRPAAAHVRETVAPSAAPVGEAPVPQASPAAAPVPAAAPAPSAPPVAAPEQTGGGLFSP
ncbi:MAG TPA: PASTA domain-containing protein [Solirubrobacteraceae bacterium]|nr:PASTA domain-containing protein [Solirubrobacteraceae bacterium]